MSAGTNKAAANNAAVSVKLLLLFMFAALVLFPIALTLSNAFMSEREITHHYGVLDDKETGEDAAAMPTIHVTIRWIPEQVTLKPFANVLIFSSKFLMLFWNSVKLTVPILLGQTAVGTLAGYAFAKLVFPGRDKLFFFYLLTMLMPFQVTLVPNYLVADKLGLLNSYGAIIWPGVFAAFGVFLMRQFTTGIPDAYLEAARIDGAGHFRAFIHIVLPIVKPGMTALILLVFADNWNMVEQPLLFLSEPFRQPLSVYLARIAEGERGVAFASSALYMAPMVLLFLYGEDQLVAGIQRSGVKG
ncbi:carbohydrate ABC transporter permease [Paenibacillus rhizovicinus]|uniref:Carbohydrate ABC transporter permease n=1 Tax=Paenibacillus rhizovicinus TaxID=2704463 RepID=A0A6C0P8Q6_9BACL|nr:carbohydrate ABC transporter permease [Paenibacillus rhizovicinus]QHW34013.1 carbohydrate ABC transporter permease [Paenibacillus rhizovicinus]